MINIFKRINTAGVTLNGQEIRHALNKGPVRTYLADLANSDAFQDATSRSIKDDRMAARECALRFLAFRLTPWENYTTNDLDGFLNEAMRKLNQISADERDNRRTDFERALRAAKNIFANDAFRKRYKQTDGRKPISKALFEVWCVNIARRSEDELRRLEALKNQVKTAFMALMNDDRSFDDAISYATSQPERVKKRFSAISALIDGVLS